VLIGIDLREDAQLALAMDLSATDADLRYGTSARPGLRYRFANGMFDHGDAVILHAMLRHFRPGRVVEVGSGFSSALMLDVNDQWLGGKTKFTFIEPYPDRLNSLLKPEDRANVRIITEPVQGVDPAIFEELASGDFLFIDSSHVSKMGSDVHCLVFDVLPQLQPGVIIHFHDVFWPFEYPTEWADEGRAWNEDYLLRAFLAYNTRFEMLLFNNWLARVHPESLAPLMPASEMPGTTSSLWLRVGT
jgi:predicted O-methyltransferase YrrM